MDELFILARRVLLDALDAIGDHRDAVVLVGAQAVYLQVGEADLAVAAFTTDGDLAIDPAALADAPPLEHALLGAGFAPKSRDSVGIWVTHRQTGEGTPVDVAVDLLVPESVSPGGGRRAARLPGHDSKLARIVKGIEGAVVDVEVMRVAALEADDSRGYELHVAGPAALLVAKVHKIDDRKDTDRQNDKDALDGPVRAADGLPEPAVPAQAPGLAHPGGGRGRADAAGAGPHRGDPGRPFPAGHHPAGPGGGAAGAPEGTDLDGPRPAPAPRGHGAAQGPSRRRAPRDGPGRRVRAPGRAVSDPDRGREGDHGRRVERLPLLRARDPIGH